MKSSKLSKENTLFWSSVFFLPYIFDELTIFQIVEEDGSLLEIGMVLYSTLSDHLYIYRGFNACIFIFISWLVTTLLFQDLGLF